uniref:Uncharacterized protein n=1 Tax=Heliothis virescens TaxID=7102 RepID=A0A2A4IY01_HELVI
MATQRTPPQSGSKLISDSDYSQDANGSTLLKNDEQLSTPIYVNTRKRKERPEEEEYNQTLLSFRADIMKFMEDFGNKQSNNLQYIREEITEIKNEIKAIKLNSEHFTERIDEINNEIENIKSASNTNQTKIKHIEDQIQQLKNMQPVETTPNSPVTHREALMQELKDRCEREKNVILVGIPEKNEKDIKARQNHDCNEVTKLTSTLKSDCPKPIKTVRLGRYIQDKNRPLKVYYNHTEFPKYLLRNKTSLPENIHVYADQTPTQKQYLQSLREELKMRTDDGEDLIIKYIKGIPTIVKNTNNQKN